MPKKKVIKKPKELTNLLNKSFQSIIKYVESATGFVKEQTPLYCQEYIKMNVFKNIVGMIYCSIGILLSIGLMVGLFLFSHHVAEIKGNGGYALNILDLFLIMVLVPACLEFSKYLDEYIEYKYAPRVQILQHLRRQIK